MMETIQPPSSGKAHSTLARRGLGRTANALWAVISAYGSMYLVRGVVGNLLLVAATMINPIAGIAGLAAGVCALAIRLGLGLAPLAGNIEILNAALVGGYLGAVFAPGPSLGLLIALASVLTVLLAAIPDRRSLGIRLPTLSVPFILVSWCALAAGTRAGIPRQAP